MKVAVVVPKYGLVGGAEKVVFELTERLARQDGMEIHVFANSWRKGAAPVIFHRVPRVSFPRWLRPIAFAFIAGRMIGGRGFDLIHSHDRIVKMDVFTMHGIPHRTWVREARKKKMSLFDLAVDWLERKGVTGSNTFILPVSSLVKDELLKVYPVPESRIRVIHPGMDPVVFNAEAMEGSRSRLRSRYGLTENDTVVLFAGMNFQIKRLDLVIDAVAAAARIRPDCRPFLLVLGRGPRERYVDQACKSGIGDRVVFAGVTDDMAAFYAASDLFAMPSGFDTFGLVVLEAMAAGLPVIITERTGAKDLVKSGLQGFVVPVDVTPGRLAECMCLLMDREVRNRMGRLARAAAAVNSWETMTSRVNDVYGSVGTSGEI